MRMIIQEAVSFYNSNRKRISGRIHRSEELSKKGIIYCHGLFSSKNGYKITTMAPELVHAGYTLLTFDFSFVGESEGHIADLSILQEVDDLKNAADFFAGYGIEKLHLIGSSMGGLVSLLHAAQDSRFHSLSLIATPVLLTELFGIMGIHDPDNLPDDGMTAVQGVLIKNKFFKEHSRIDIEQAIRAITIPTLIIHGERDAVVTVENAHYLYRHLHSEKKMTIIASGDHSLTRNSDIMHIRENIIDWIRMHE